jgi:hypothetical protein
MPGSRKKFCPNGCSQVIFGRISLDPRLRISCPANQILLEQSNWNVERTRHLSRGAARLYAPPCHEMRGGNRGRRREELPGSSQCNSTEEPPSPLLVPPNPGFPHGCIWNKVEFGHYLILTVMVPDSGDAEAGPKSRVRDNVQLHRACQT